MAGQEGGIYHIYNRGTDKRLIFDSERDYLRFIDGLRKFRAEQPVGAVGKRLVDVLCFCLMPNHYHLLLRSRNEEGLTKFMRRLSTGYTMYYNKKNGRQGVLFESNYKSRRIEDDAYLLQVSRYIHLNPLSLVEPGWKEQGIADREKVSAFLRGYRWSSLPAYTGKASATEVVDASLLLEIIGGREKYVEFMSSALELP
jgi:putative transposase